MTKIKFDESVLKKRLIKEVEVKFFNKINALLLDLKEATPKDTKLASNSWFLKRVNGLEAVISNEQDYIIILNNGSSKQAPRNFIEITMLNNGFTLKSSIKNKI
jgi:hypothetical protein